MLATRRAASSSSRQLGCTKSTIRRRYASNESHTSHAAHPQSANESFGKGFYITIAAIPLSIICYQYASTSPNDALPRFFSPITSFFSDPTAALARRTALHAAAVESAALDRQLFSYAGAQETHAVELFSPEATLNRASPINVAAGEQSADLRKLKAYYDGKQHEMETERQARAKKQGGVRTVYDTRSGMERFREREQVEVGTKGLDPAEGVAGEEKD